MHGSEGINTSERDRDIRRDSSQTLPNQQFHPSIGEEEQLDQYQLPKQVHTSEHVIKSTISQQADDIRSYKSGAEIGQPSKNMKDSIESKFDYRFDSRTGNTTHYIQSRERRSNERRADSLVKSANELASKYEQKLNGSSAVNPYSDQNTKLTSSMNNPTEQHMHLINDLSLENKCSRIDMVHESTASNNVKHSMDGSYLNVMNETDMNKDMSRSRSRSNHQTNDMLSNMQLGGGEKSILSPKMDDDEITERIRLQGERLIQMPEIVKNQPYKQLERAMKDSQENIHGSVGRRSSERAPKTNGQTSKDLNTMSNQDESSLTRQKTFKDYSRELSNGREDKANRREEIFDGSFGRKKREEDTSHDYQRQKRFKIESQHFKDIIGGPSGSFDTGTAKGIYGQSESTFERRFGMNGPSARANKTSRLSQRDFMGIGSGIPLVTYERQSKFNQPGNDKELYRGRESKSIPRASIAFDHLDQDKADEKKDSNFSELVKRSEMRRTYSTSPYGGPRNNITSAYRTQVDKPSEFKNNYTTENKYNDLNRSEPNFQNRFRSPLDDLYKKHQNNTLQTDQKDEVVDDQFKQCQDLLQRAKDRRLKMSQPGQKEEPIPKNNEIYQSRINIKERELIDVPDVKSLQSRYEYLMDTIKEKESEGQGTQDSKNSIDDDGELKRANYAKTMKWKKSEKNAIQYSEQQVSDYNARPLRVPKPPQSANQKSNITQTYEWLMRKHDINNTNDSNTNMKSGLTEHRYHAISFGNMQDSSLESLKNPSFLGSRHNSLGKPPDAEKERAYAGNISTVNKYRPDLSYNSRGQSNNSNERSFYKPMSPDIDFKNQSNQTRMQYNPSNQLGGVHDYKFMQEENSLEREKISVPSSFEYQSRTFGTQPQAQKKFQIERRHYENLQYDKYGSSNLNIGTEPAYQSKPFEPALTSSMLNQSQGIITGQTSSMLNTSQNPLGGASSVLINGQSNFLTSAPPSNVLTSAPSKQLQAPQVPTTNYVTGSTNSYQNLPPAVQNTLPPATQSTLQNTLPPVTQSALPQVCGQIGKIVRQNHSKPDLVPPVQNQPDPSLHSTKLMNGEFNESLLNSTYENMNKQDLITQNNAINVQQNLHIEVQRSAPYTQATGPPLHASDKVSQVSQSIKSPQSNAQPIQLNSEGTVFQRLEKAQALFRSTIPKQQSDTDTQTSQSGYKLMFFSRHAPSVQQKQFNGELINDLVSHIENITNLFVENVRTTGPNGTDKQNPLSSLDFKEEQTGFQEIGQHLKEKYDTTKDPNTWVPQLYADMCKARNIATENEENCKKEKEKNDELMQQIETLERDLLTFRKDLVQMENCQSTNRDVQFKLKEQISNEMEWMERLDALISSQKFYTNGEAPKTLPESTFDVDTIDSKKVFSQLLNKLEVLLCHTQLEKSKSKKFLETTVKQMDSRISTISQKFNKIQQKIIETCSIEETENEEPDKSMKGTELDKSQKGTTSRSSLTSVKSTDCPNMKGTIDMLKKMRRDRDEQERIIESLKQIIQIQDKLYKANSEKLFGNMRQQVVKNIENFVTEEHKKPAKNMQLGWVAEVSEISMTYDINESGIQRKQQNEIKNEYGDIYNNICENTQDSAILNQITHDFNDLNRRQNVQMVTSEVQTDFNLNDRINATTKVYKEIRIQTEPVQIKTIEDSQSEYSVAQKSSTTTEKREKQLSAFQEGLQQNMNDLLTQQLSKHLSQNMNEIATIKQENGRLIEKYKFEQKQVNKLKDELRKKQKFEQFFEKQRAKKYRNCGCQIGPSQIKSINEDVTSSQYQHQKSQSSIALKSQQNLTAKRFNKENRSKQSDKNFDSAIVLRNVLKSPIPSVNLRSPEDHGAKSGTDITSLNTQVMQTKYGVRDSSMDEKNNFTCTRGNSQIYNCSGDFSKSASIIDESVQIIDRDPPMPPMPPPQTNNDMNIQEKQMLQYHIKKNQELHEVLRAYLIKFEEGKGNGTPDAQALVSLLNPQVSNNQFVDNIDTLNQRQSTSKEVDDHTAASNLASSANFGIREAGKDTKSINNTAEKKKVSQNNNVNASNAFSLEYSENTEMTKKCDYIDQYFNYKSLQKRSDMAMVLQNQNSRQIVDDAYRAAGHLQSFGDTNDLTAAIIGHQNRSNSGQPQQRASFIQPQQSNSKMIENVNSQVDHSRTERISVQVEDQEEKAYTKPDDVVSDNINVSEQIKSIEGRQMFLCDIVDSQHASINNTGKNLKQKI